MWKKLMMTVCIGACVMRTEAQDGPGWDIRLSVPGEPGKDYPTLGTIPRTSFTCGGKEAGYYADAETGCQAFRVCTKGATYGYQSFLCPNGTIFNQEVFVCDWWMNVNCQGSEQHFQMNNKFENLRVGLQMMNDVKKMIMYPMLNPYQNQNNLPNKKVIMQVYSPPSGQLNPNQGSQFLDDNRNPRAHFVHNNNGQSNIKPAISRQQYTSPNNIGQGSQLGLNENSQTKSTQSAQYISAISNDHHSDHAKFSLLPTSTVQPDLEVTYRKQQYTYPSQADKQYTYKIPSSEVASLNQQSSLSLGKIETQQNYVDARQNLAYVHDFFNGAVEEAQKYQNSVNQNIQNFISNGVTQNTNTLHDANLQLTQNLERLAKSHVANLQLANEHMRTSQQGNEQSFTNSQQTDTQRTAILGGKLQNTASQYFDKANSQITNEQKFTNSLNNNLRQNSIDSSGSIYSGYLNQGQNAQQAGNFVAQNEQSHENYKNLNGQSNFEQNQFSTNTQFGGQQVDTASNYHTESNLNSNLNINSDVRNNGVQAERLLQYNNNGQTQQANNKYPTPIQQNQQSTIDESGKFYSSQFSNGGQQHFNNLNTVGQVNVNQQNILSSSGIYNLHSNAQNEQETAYYNLAKNINNQGYNAQVDGVNYQGLQKNIQTVNNYDEILGNVNYQPGFSHESNTNQHNQAHDVNAGVIKFLSSEAESLSDIIDAGKFTTTGAVNQHNYNIGLAPTSTLSHQEVGKDDFKTSSHISNINGNINSNQNFIATNYDGNRNDVTAQYLNQLHSSIIQPVNNQNLATYQADQAYYVYSKYSGSRQPENTLNVVTKQNFETNHAERNYEYNTQTSHSIRNNLKKGSIETSVQFLPSVSFQLDDEDEQQKFFSAVKSGILGDTIEGYKVNVGDGESSGGVLSSSQRVPANNQKHSIQHTVPTHQTVQQLQGTTPTRLYDGPSSYVAPQQSIGRLGTGFQEATEGLVTPTSSVQRSYVPERLEDLDEKVEGGYPKITPSVSFAF